MIKTFGKSVFEKTVIGHIKKIDNRPVKNEIEKESKDEEAYLTDFQTALSLSKEQLALLYEKALKEVGEDEASIFEVHLMLLDDEGFIEDIEDNIKSGNSAIKSVSLSKEKYSNLFISMDDEYMQSRALDIEDISKRIIRNLKGEKETDYILTKPVILFAYDLTPSETISMDKSKILGILTVKGSVNSHTAILARTMEIPALVNVDIDIDNIKEDEECIVDGINGIAYISPEKSVKEDYVTRIKRESENRKLLKAYINKRTITKEGKAICLYANISAPSDVESVIENGAEGIGLFRSEFLYIGKSNSPSEEEQFEAYKNVLCAMQGKPVIIRTLDIGADKQASYLNMDREDNPAMGVRAIRLCLCKPDLFKTQLRALFRASVFGDLKVMFPMITSERELDSIFEVIEEVKASLEKEKVSYKLPIFGIMIETPAAAIISDMLAKRVGFFSIGTNDLTQYTLAMDRQAENLDHFFDPHHEAVLRLIELTVKNAHDAGIQVGICGELGSDYKLTNYFIDLGVDELSMSPSKILEVRKNICES